MQHTFKYLVNLLLRYDFPRAGNLDLEGAPKSISDRAIGVGSNVV